ncbi:hypothetical protein E2C01_038127 [Portunus trituberculatus]|uniref:Uncharacterized protein n=1 Tax=Portunus trituberculatus TaxID=210409 RepID=A0A5B7FJ37_PORTR|nr:hypothetical protein [Portunus trituberculatus]
MVTVCAAGSTPEKAAAGVTTASGWAGLAGTTGAAPPAPGDPPLHAAVFRRYGIAGPCEPHQTNPLLPPLLASFPVGHLGLRGIGIALCAAWVMTAKMGRAWQEA